MISGNIIFRQRGTDWFPGDNCAMGRDHTIYATESGFMKYYKDPEKHPKRQFIGVVFKRDQVLPLPRNAHRRRRLGMLAVKMEVPHLITEGGELAVSQVVLESEGGRKVKEVRVGRRRRGS